MMKKTINFRLEVCRGCGKIYNGNDHNQGLNHAKSCGKLIADKLFEECPGLIEGIKKRLKETEGDGNGQS
jgi:hypothetical protein